MITVKHNNNYLLCVHYGGRLLRCVTTNIFTLDLGQVICGKAIRVIMK